MSTLRQQIAQMLVMGFSGTALTDENPVKYWLSEEGIGGVILFDRMLNQPDEPKNLVDKAQIKTLTCALKEAACDRALPPFIAIDYEGGEVDRLQWIEGCPKTLRPADLAQLTPHHLWEKTSEMAGALRELGFNLNFAPVVDLAVNTKAGIIGKRGRSFTAIPEKMAELASLFVEAFFEEGILCCYKHFPGHGSASGDTHLGFVDVTETFSVDELIPYRRLLQEHPVPVMVMTAHVINRQLDPSGMPATLSTPILTNLLRHEIGFEGVVVSDDVQMRALSAHYPLEEILARTIQAGADMIIFGNQWGNHTAPEVIDMIEKLVLSGQISSSRIEEAYGRIVRLKSSML